MARSKILLRILPNLSILTLFLLIIFMSLFYYAENDAFYYQEFEKTGVFKKYGHESVLKISGNVQEFLKGNEELKYFNEDEQAHLKDVARLFKVAAIVYSVSAVVFILCLLSLFFIRHLDKKYKEFIADIARIFIVGAGLTLVVGLFVFLARGLFSTLFVGFHEVFFSGGWTFPAHSLLINIFTTEFFFDITMRIFGLVAIISAVFLAIGVYIIVLKKRLR